MSGIYGNFWAAVNFRVERNVGIGIGKPGTGNDKEFASVSPLTIAPHELRKDQDAVEVPEGLSLRQYLEVINDGSD